MGNFQTGMVRQNMGTKELEQKKDGKWVPASVAVKNAFVSDKVTFQNNDGTYNYYMYQFSESKARAFLESNTDINEVIKHVGEAIASAFEYTSGEMGWRDNMDSDELDRFEKYGKELDAWYDRAMAAAAKAIRETK